MLLNVSRYEKYVPDSGSDKKKLSAKGAFEEYYVDLIDQINSLNLVGLPALLVSIELFLLLLFNDPFLLSRKPRRAEMKSTGQSKQP